MDEATRSELATLAVTWRSWAKQEALAAAVSRHDGDTKASRWHDGRSGALEGCASELEALVARSVVAKVPAGSAAPGPSVVRAVLDELREVGSIPKTDTAVSPPGDTQPRGFDCTGESRRFDSETGPVSPAVAENSGTAGGAGSGDPSEAPKRRPSGESKPHRCEAPLRLDGGGFDGGPSLVVRCGLSAGHNGGHRWPVFAWVGHGEAGRLELHRVFASVGMRE